MSEEAARKAGKDVQILRWPFSENDRAQAERATEGLVKLVTDRKGVILGATIIGRDAGDQLIPFVLALRKKLSVRDLAELTYPYPTLSEAGKRAAAPISPRCRVGHGFAASFVS